METYLGISYLKDGEPDWSQEQLDAWKDQECIKGNHLWDEVLSVDRHYLYCDACGETKDI
jgi:hypothetical protein